MKVKKNFQLLNQLFAIRESVESLEEQNETLDKIQKAIEILVTSEPAATEPQTKFDKMFSDIFQGFKPTVATMSELKNAEYEEFFKKFEEVQQSYIEEGIGWIFEPEYIKRDYDVDITALEFGTHYKSSLSALIDGDGVRPSLSIYFTDVGMRYLIANYKSIREKIEKEWKEYQTDIKGGAK